MEKEKSKLYFIPTFLVPKRRRPTLQICKQRCRFAEPFVRVGMMVCHITWAELMLLAQYLGHTQCIRTPLTHDKQHWPSRVHSPHLSCKTSHAAASSYTVFKDGAHSFAPIRCIALKSLRAMDGTRYALKNPPSVPVWMACQQCYHR